MSMGERPDVPTASKLATARTLGSLVLTLAAGITRGLASSSVGGPRDPEWSVSRQVIQAAMKSFLGFAQRLRTDELRSVEMELDRISGWVFPPPFLRREVEWRKDAVLGGIPGEWIRPATPPYRGTVLYFHGGGYLATAPLMYGALATQLALRTRTQVFLADYRLAPEFPFPAALEDAVSVYRGALDRGHPPDSLLVAGDSGGGGLAAALCIALSRHGLPLPAGLVLLSPEVDLAASGQSRHTNADTDILPDRVEVDAYLNGTDPRDPLVSPLYADMTGLPPMLVAVGEDEMFRDEILDFADRARAHGVEIWLDLEPNVFHVYPIVLPLARESMTTWANVTTFAEARLGLLHPPGFAADEADAPAPSPVVVPFDRTSTPAPGRESATDPTRPVASERESRDP